MTKLLLLTIFLVGCFPTPEGNTTALHANDQKDLSLIQKAWLHEGLPNPPKKCWSEAKVVWPATTADIIHYCKDPAADACLSSQRTDFFGDREPLLVVSANQPRESWRHEMVHLWAKCSGMPWWFDHPPQFCRILQRDVEGTSYYGSCQYMLTE